MSELVEMRFVCPILKRERIRPTCSSLEFLMKDVQRVEDHFMVRSLLMRGEFFYNKFHD